MLWKRYFSLGLAACLGSAAAASAQTTLPMLPGTQPPAAIRLVPSAPTSTSVQAVQPAPADKPMPMPMPMPSDPSKPMPVPMPAPELRASDVVDAPAAPADDGPKYGPTPLLGVNIINDLIYGEGAKDMPIKINAWADFDYTYRSTGSGQNNIAPVMNRYGDEALARQLGVYVHKDLDAKEWSWGFNAIFIAGADASFLGPTAGWYANTNPRFGTQFTDLNVTAHLDVLTEGGIDVKVGRQTTCLGPMGALAWQRPFNSSDYAWYNLEEGRYTGISTNFKVNKQLSIYNGIEVGGWGTFYDNASHSIDYLGQINYWLDCEAKKAKVWATLLCGPTGFTSDGNTTIVELGAQYNVNERMWVILDTQMCYSKAPIFFNPPPGYQERAYDVYSYAGYHLTEKVDLNGRVEWYKDVDGGGYPGGFGIPHNDYFAITTGIDFHPKKWIQFRPEIRWDHATKDAFGSNYDKKDQLTIDGDVLIKF